MLDRMGTIFCAGGNEKGIADNSTEFYDWTNQIWMPAANMNRRRSDFGLACVSGKIFAIGGWTDFGKRLKSTEVYDPELNYWQKCSSLRTSRSQVTVCPCTNDGSIYAIGGEGRGNLARRSVERYDVGADRWTEAPKMNEKRWSACSCSNGCLYVMGGFNAGALASCERFDPRSGKWTKVAPMGQRRCGGAVAALEDGNIYVVGGMNEKMAALASCECYNPKMDRWELMPSMKHPRSYFGVAPFDDGRFLYALGGADVVEVFDPRTRLWSTSDMQLGCKRSRHAVVWCNWPSFPTRQFPTLRG